MKGEKGNVESRKNKSLLLNVMLIASVDQLKTKYINIYIIIVLWPSKFVYKTYNNFGIFGS